MAGSYIIFGIIDENLVNQYNSDLYNFALCVASDSTFYNVNLIQGILFMGVEDIITIEVKNDIVLISCGDKFIFEGHIKQDIHYKPYFAWAAGSTTKISLILDD